MHILNKIIDFNNGLKFCLILTFGLLCFITVGFHSNVKADCSTFLCEWGSNGTGFGKGANGDNVTLSPGSVLGGSGTAGDPYTEQAGSPLNLTLGYYSYNPSPQHVFVWTQIPDFNHNLSDSNIVPSNYAPHPAAAMTEYPFCSTVVMSPPSKYANPTWEYNSGGSVTCNGFGDLLCYSGSSSYYSPVAISCPGVGSYSGQYPSPPAAVSNTAGHTVVWYENNTTQGTHDFPLQINSPTPTGEFCLRTHVSESGGFWPTSGSPEDIAYQFANDYDDVQGISSASSICFQFISPPPPPVVSPGCSNTQASDSGFGTYVNIGGLAPDGSGWSTHQNDVDIPGATNTVWTDTEITVTDSAGNTLLNTIIGHQLAKSGNWNYTPLGQTVTVTIVHREHLLSHNGNEYWETYSTAGSGGPIVCYSASCVINSVLGVGTPNNVVEAGGTAQVNATITNTGPLNLYQPFPTGAPLSLTDGGPNPVPTAGIPPGGSAPVTFYLAAPATGPGYMAINAYPDYYGAFILGAICSAGPGLNVGGQTQCVNVACKSVYGPFSITVNAHINPKDSLGRYSVEDPTTIGYDTEVINGESYQIDDPVQSQFSGPPGNIAGPVNPGGPWNSGTDYVYNTSYNPPTINAGDMYCAYISIAYTGGLIGPGGPGDIVGASGPETVDPCFTVVNEPYTHFLGNDVSAGGGFGNNCSQTNGGIYTYTDSTQARPNGSGSQFGAQALGVIEGFSSANLRGAAPLGSTGLTFSNRRDFVFGSAPGAPNLGGNVGLTVCAPDYYSLAPPYATAYGSPNIDNAQISTLPTGQHSYKFSSAGTALTVGGAGDITVPQGVNLSIFSDGDVYIDHNISYQGSSSWSSISSIPSIMIVAKGNIYISPNVTNLDGVYVAEPANLSQTNPSDGYINTCSEGPTTENVSQLYNDCKNQLIVNGDLYAANLYLDRSYSSLRYSQSGENIINSSGHTCGNVGKDVPSASTQTNKDCASEIINTSPELYLSQPAITPSSGPTLYRYNDITSLPPVL